MIGPAYGFGQVLVKGPDGKVRSLPVGGVVPGTGGQTTFEYEDALKKLEELNDWAAKQAEQLQKFIPSKPVQNQKVFSPGSSEIDYKKLLLFGALGVGAFLIIRKAL